MKVPNTNTSLLSNPSKMPGYSWGLPAHRACSRANGTICQGCYAAKGAYAWRTVNAAYETRFTWTRECMKTAEGRAEFVAVLTAAISRATRKQPFFRVHDSGDFFSPAYAQCWLEIMRALPNVQFWAPTRTWQQPLGGNTFRIMGQDDPILATLREMSKLPNVTIRPSALNFGDDAPVVDGLSAGSTADGSGKQCPAPQQGNQCGECRACWIERDTPISYRKH